MIYCGYQGCGKTTYCKANPSTAIDLDSSTFEKHDGWEYEYIQKAQDLEKETGKNIFISAHQCVINALRKLRISFEVFIPAYDKEAWRNRLAFRYNTAPHQGNFNALADFDKHFDADMEFYATLPPAMVHKVSATVITDMGAYLTDT